MKVVLELQDQPSNIKKVTVRHDIVIGRGAECNLRLSAPQVSRRHCFLRISDNKATVTDLESSNGTWVGGKRLASGKRHALEDGARLAIGPVQFTVRVVSEALPVDALQVKVNDELIEADADLLATPAPPPDGSSVGDILSATVADSLSDDDRGSMNFAIESAGPAAEEDDPTTDYLSAGSNYFDDDEITVASIVEDDDIARDDNSYFAEIDGAEVLADDEVVEVVEVIGEGDDVEVVDEILAPDAVEIIEEDEDLVYEVDVVEEDIVEVVDDEIDEVELVDDDLLIEEDNEVLLVDEEEVLVIEDDELLADAGDSAQVDPDSSDEDDLRDFLKGLD